MESIKTSVTKALGINFIKPLFFAACFFIFLFFVSAQEPSQLGAEILAIEQILSNPNISNNQRYDSFVRLARLRQLSGDIEAAANNWLFAAALYPGDGSTTIAAAFCLAAIGEWARASSLLRPLLEINTVSDVTLRARYLDAALRVWLSSNATPLVNIAFDPLYLPLRPMIYYTLWQTLVSNPSISGAGAAASWRYRLLSEYPNSPEARVASPPQDGRNPVNIVQSPLWLLLPGQLRLDSNQPNTIPVQPAIPQIQAPAPANQNTQNLFAQVGVFSRQENALSQIQALARAGFSALLQERSAANGQSVWAVLVNAGTDPQRTLRDLQVSGFEAILTRQ